MPGAYFGPGFFRFLKDLKANNTREWFADNKARYDADVEGPMRQFITDLAPRLKTISPRLKVDPRRVGGSMFRIHRDTRFSHDKSPYKTAVAARFTHDAPGLETHGRPGFYIHLSPGESVGGGGIYHPDPSSLQRIRDAIVSDPRGWARATDGLDIEGETLKRVPRGFPPDHPRADDLKRKDHYVMVSFTAKDVTSPGFLDTYVETCERVTPLVAFVARALDLRW